MQFYTSDDIPAQLAQRSFSAGLTRIMPNGGAPLFALSGYAKKKTAKDIEHGYWSKEMVYPKAVAVGAYGTGDTVLTVVSSAQLGIGSILRVQAAYNGAAQTHTVLAENLFVTAIPNATQIVVRRGWMGTTAASIVDGQVFVEIGNSFEQGSNAPNARAVKPIRHMNYTQIFRDAWDITGTLNAIKMEIGYNTVSENRQDAAAFHAQGIEKAAFFGKKGLDEYNGRPISNMDGIERLIYQYAPSNLYEAGASTSFTQLESYLNPVFDYVTDAMYGNVRTLFVGSQAMMVINRIGMLSGVYQLMDGQTGFGLQFKQFKTTRGTFNVIEHPLFNTNEDWKKMAIALDLSSFDFAYLEGRDTFHTDINTKGHSAYGKDAIGGVLTTEVTVEMKNPFASAIIYNLRAAA